MKPFGCKIAQNTRFHKLFSLLYKPFPGNWPKFAVEGYSPPVPRCKMQSTSFQRMNAMVKRSKALLMLVVFTTNFYTVCHCTPLTNSSATPHRLACCRNHHPSAAPGSPCNNKKGCCQTHSIKFNLLEKQPAPSITIHPVPAAALTHHFIGPVVTLITYTPIPAPAQQQRYRKKAPPDFQSLYQLFLI
jgi:hypothetical protein